MNAPDRRALLLDAVVACVQPLVRLLVRHGVTYPALAGALKPLFVDAARHELQRHGMRRTDSAVTLLSGVHRKDVRALHAAAEPSSPGRQARGRQTAAAPALSLVGQVVAAWQSQPRWRASAAPRVLPRSGATRSFDALVHSISQDVRPRAMLDEMLRLGVVQESPRGLTLQAEGFVPRAGFDAMCEAMALNLGDHAAAAATNLADDTGRLEQAVYVDEITAESAAHLHAAARAAWKNAFAAVMAEAQIRFDHDAAQATPATRTHRARFGVYFFDQHVGPLATDGDAPSR